MKPLAALVAAANGDIVAFERQDGSECLRFEMAFGKAASALATGRNSRYLAEKALSGSSVVTLVNMRTGGRAMSFPGAILVKSESGTILGVVAITGDTAENDEVCAIAGIRAAGLIPGEE